MGFVVDASVCTKWFFEEDHWEAAARLLEGGHELSAPDLLTAEFGNVVWKKLSRNEINLLEGVEALDAIVASKVKLTPAVELATASLSIAASLRHPFYDCLYLALAQREHLQVVTADQRLRRKVAGTPYAALLLWIEDVP